MCLLLYLYSTCQTLNKYFFLDWIACGGVYSSERWSQKKGTFSVWRALNLYSSTTIRWSIEIFKKKISDLWGGIDVCDNSRQGSSARMRRFNRPSRIVPSSPCWLETKLCHRGTKKQKMWCCETFLGPQFRLLEEWLWINCRIMVGVFCQHLKGFKGEACVSPWLRLHNKKREKGSAMCDYFY